VSIREGPDCGYSDADPCCVWVWTGSHWESDGRVFRREEANQLAADMACHDGIRVCLTAEGFRPLLPWTDGYG